MPKVRTTEEGIEQQCTKCGEWLPQDKDFFWRNRRTDTGYQCRCIACFHEYPSMQRRAAERSARSKMPKNSTFLPNGSAFFGKKTS